MQEQIDYANNLDKITKNYTGPLIIPIFTFFFTYISSWKYFYTSNTNIRPFDIFSHFIF